MRAQCILVCLAISLSLGIHGNPAPDHESSSGSGCGGDSLCILDSMLREGLINQQQYQRNKNFITRPKTSWITSSQSYPSPRYLGNQEDQGTQWNQASSDNQGDSRRPNSKYNPDCWAQDGQGGQQSRRIRSGRGHAQGREQERTRPCLWETDYYLGDETL
ncbi:uncharacterized protein LOC111708361 [Eurytemora carolleeae]|uniref:uncharacterized protein LOC111708361 n=1 Tax=Eurytemora carolleeae TaxID=1294199 RepID=UPI000C76FF14|nr:uncharacterized protein LOC111708361 [Eurytemora carolleeae]|eukprot:XP_023337472.1 uncharacterized protein LOC111708361 [Eurytemora affinis]